mgnify:CR=1 FL=1
MAGRAAPDRGRSSAPQRQSLSSLAATQPRLVRSRRSRKSPRARTNWMARRRGRCRRAVRARAPPDPPSPSRRPTPRHAAAVSAAAPAGPGFLLAGTSSDQDHEPDRGAAASRSYRAVDRGLPQRTRRDPSRHHRGDAAPGDRIDRERNPLAVRAASTTTARTAPTPRRWPASNARWPKSAKCCAR